ncbi:MAG: hypothetical protein JKY65_23025 [Planctomycetes bacterium]|nr:hypothetical protein [Planctomycetota bacterium]
MRATLVAPLLACALASQAFAHGFLIDLEWTGTEIRGEAFFNDGLPPGEGTWSAFRAGEQTALAKGSLDASGHFRWSPPGPGRYRCEVREIGLHKASAEVDVSAPTPAAISSATPTLALPEARRKARGRGGWGKTRIKRLLTGLGGIALLGVGLYRFQRRRREREAEDEPQGDSERGA